MLLSIFHHRDLWWTYTYLIKISFFWSGREGRSRTDDTAFAEPCLTTWLPRAFIKLWLFTTTIYSRQAAKQVHSVYLLAVNVALFHAKAFVTFVECRGQASKVFTAVTHCAALLNLMCICVILFHFFYLCFLKDREPSQSLKFSASILPLLYWK